MNNKFNKNEIEDFYVDVGKKVKEFRTKNNLTQLDLSYAMGYKSVIFGTFTKLLN